MSEYLEKLKTDMADAQRRFVDAQQKMTAFQAEFQAAQQDFMSYQRIVARQTHKEQQATTSATGATPTSIVPLPTEPTDEVNKTGVIREVLRQHPAGITPSELFDTVKDKVGRAYMYSVLKRLRDKDEVLVRRKKYYLKATPKPEGTGEHAIVQ
jgi:hypothetical protein